MLVLVWIKRRTASKQRAKDKPPKRVFVPKKPSAKPASDAKTATAPPKRARKPPLANRQANLDANQPPPQLTEEEWKAGSPAPTGRICWTIEHPACQSSEQNSSTTCATKFGFGRGQCSEFPTRVAGRAGRRCSGIAEVRLVRGKTFRDAILIVPSGSFAH